MAGSKAKKSDSESITIVTACAVAGQPLEQGATLSVPTDISDSDAKTLIKMGRAVLTGAGSADAE